MKYPKYSKYSETNINWIDKIPEHWEIKPIKFIKASSKYAFVDGPFGSNLKSEHFVDYGEVYVIESEFATRGTLEINKLKKITYEHFETIKRSETKNGDIIIAKIGEYFGLNNILHSLDYNAVVSGNSMKLTLNSNYSNKFIHYALLFLKWCGAIDLQVNTTAQPALSLTKMNTIKIAFPEIEEQKSIADFLDYKTSQIDNLIEEKEKLLELLEEKRIALITNAVTKGLNPDVEMKLIATPWIKEMPSHWKKNRIKFSTYVKGRVGWHGLNSDEFLYEGDYYLVTGTDFIKKEIIWNTCYRITKERYDEDPYIHLQENDLLITKDGTIGKLAIVKNIPFKASVNSGIFVTRPLKDEYLTEYMYYLLSSYVFQEFINFNKTGTTINHLYQEVFENFEYTFPESLEEQKNIVDFLNEEIIKLDDITEEIFDAIDKLKEYRSALITSAVTGKIDVRNFKPEYENEKTY